MPSFSHSTNVSIVQYLSRRSFLVAASNIKDCSVHEENAITRSNDKTGTRVHTTLLTLIGTREHTV